MFYTHTLCSDNTSLIVIKLIELLPALLSGLTYSESGSSASFSLVSKATLLAGGRDHVAPRGLFLSPERPLLPLEVLESLVEPPQQPPWDPYFP